MITGLPMQIGVASGGGLVEAGGGGGVGGGCDDIRVGLGLAGDGLHGVGEIIWAGRSATIAALCRRGDLHRNDIYVVVFMVLDRRCVMTQEAEGNFALVPVSQAVRSNRPACPPDSHPQ